MDIFDVLNNSGRAFFVIDEIEDKKTQSLVKQINNQFANILSKLEDFRTFAKSQLEGEYHQKIVMAKSLKATYANWSAISSIYSSLEKEEKEAINKFNSYRTSLLANLKLLLSDVRKLPVVASYDVFNGQYAITKKDHTVVIYGKNNVAIIESLINDIEENLVIEGNFDKVEEVELSVNYSSVDKNVSMCSDAIEDLFANKPSKGTKVLNIVKMMEKAGQDLVLFATYKDTMKEIGCNVKEVNLYEKELLKKYIPLKKQLGKLLKVSFVDVCDIVHNEEEFPTQEFKVIDDDLFEE